MRCSLAFAVLAAGLVLAAPAAHANGDPASDVLYFQDVFLPYAKPSAEATTQVTNAVAAAGKAGYRIKVAVISSAQDLGAVPSLFGKPQLYARFLGTELRAFYASRLLVVMPQGFGIYSNNAPTTDEEQALAGVKIESEDPDGLTKAAAAAVDKLRESGQGSTGKDRVAPTVKAIAATAKRGAVAQLRYTVSDNSGKSRETVRVYGANFLLYATLVRPLAPAKAGVIENVVWRVPKTLKPGTLKFCVLAQDAAGNQSRPGCAPLKIT